MTSAGSCSKTCTQNTVFKRHFGVRCVSILFYLLLTSILSMCLKCVMQIKYISGNGREPTLAQVTNSPASLNMYVSGLWSGPHNTLIVLHISLVWHYWPIFLIYSQCFMQNTYQLTTYDVLLKVKPPCSKPL